MAGNELGYIEKIVHLNRVAKVVKGGRNFKFSALVVVGDGEGKVGSAQGKANQVPDAIAKGTERAKKSLYDIPVLDGTLPYQVQGEYCGASVLIKPAGAGTGIIAGGPVRAIMEALGVTDVLTKSLGSNNPVNVVKATLTGLLELRTPEEVSRIRGKELTIARAR